MPNAPFLAPERDAAYKVGTSLRGGGNREYLLPGFAATTVSTLAPTNDTDYYAPLYLQSPLVVDQLTAEVAALDSGKVFRMGLYAADTLWQPVGAPLADSGDISTTTTGVKTYTPGTPLVLPRGRYVTAFNSNSLIPATWRALVGSLGTGSLIVATMGTNPFATQWQVGRAYAAFPTPGTAWTATNNQSTPLRHVVLLRVSAP